VTQDLQNIKLLSDAGAIAFYALYDYPDTAKFLTKDEREEVYRRLEHDSNGLDDRFQLKYVLDAFKDWKIWVNAIITVSSAH